MSFQDPTRDEILAMANCCGIEHQQLTPAACLLQMTAEGAIGMAEATFDSTAQLVLQSIYAGRQSAVRALQAPIEMTDEEIDRTLSTALGPWARQQRWLELVGRPAARALLAHLNGAWAARMGTDAGETT